MDLVRGILLALEDHPTGSAPEIKIEGYTDDQIHYHSYIMMQAGLIEGLDYNSVGRSGPGLLPSSLTWGGHEFLAAAREPKRWKEAKELVDKVGGAPIQVWVSVLSDMVKQSLGLG